MMYTAAVDEEKPYLELVLPTISLSLFFCFQVSFPREIFGREHKK